MKNSQIKVTIVEALSDNYIFILWDEITREAAVFDPCVASLVLDFVLKHQLYLTKIFITHHHHDHVGGIEEIKAVLPHVKVYASAYDKGRIPEQTCYLNHNDLVHFSFWHGKALCVPGHTLGHLVYQFFDENLCEIVFVGDTIFSGGCGRVFEGTMSQMFQSIKMLRDVLSDNANIYCSHEYTLSNYSKLVCLEPFNSSLAEKLINIKNLRDQGIPTIPFLWGEEKKLSSILRWDDCALKETLGIESDEETFVCVRLFLNQSLNKILQAKNCQ